MEESLWVIGILLINKMQKAYSFDAITQNKILKGAMIALTGSAALGLLTYVGTIKIDDPTLAMFIVWLIPTISNLVREWMKGA